ncbi:hypothetical protein EYF80_039700 [Liparis tanakae]|uniref:Uncharacterized protein n=1 Tax=Liparis tanakae TaxID=230148 RepID=A0A4Z2GBK0_9TELE|nr:hypothetical protein EYF80_039700 [Liparis tanakae]
MAALPSLSLGTSLPLHGWPAFGCLKPLPVGKKEKTQLVHRVSSAAATRMRTAQSGDVAAGRSLFGEASRFLEKL